MIDGKSKGAFYLAKCEIFVLLFDTSYNQDVSRENIIRVVDWKGVYETVGRINKLQTKFMKH